MLRSFSRYKFSQFNDKSRRARLIRMVVTIFFTTQCLIAPYSSAQALHGHNAQLQNTPIAVINGALEGLTKIDEEARLADGRPVQILVETSDAQDIEQVVVDATKYIQHSNFAVVESEVNPPATRAFIENQTQLQKDLEEHYKTELVIQDHEQALGLNTPMLSHREKIEGAALAVVNTGIASYVYFTLLRSHPIETILGISATAALNLVFGTTDLDSMINRWGHVKLSLLASKLGLKIANNPRRLYEVNNAITWSTWSLLRTAAFTAMGVSNSVFKTGLLAFSMGHPWRRTFDRWRERPPYGWSPFRVLRLSRARSLLSAALYPFILVAAHHGVVSSTAHAMIYGLALTGWTLFLYKSRPVKISLGDKVRTLVARMRIFATRSIKSAIKQKLSELPCRTLLETPGGSGET